MAKTEGVPKVDRRTVDLSAYPDLVVIYLGMRVNAFAGLKRLLGLGPQIADSVKAKPDGLLLHEDMLFSLFPLHVGMRQYWRDFESLEQWSRSEPHRQWWKTFLRDSGGTGFWHETYALRGGFEAIYDDLPQPHWHDEICTAAAGARQPFLGPPAAAPRRFGKFTSAGVRIGPVSRLNRRRLVRRSQREAGV